MTSRTPVTTEQLEDIGSDVTNGVVTDESELKANWIYNRMKKRRNEFTQKSNFSVFCGTWNVNNKVLESADPPGM